MLLITLVWEKQTEKEMSEENESIKEFQDYYAKVIDELDVLNRGVYDTSDAEQTAALCLLAQSKLIPVLGIAEFRARGLKRDIEFSKAEAYANIREDLLNKKEKATDAAVKQLIERDSEVHKLYYEQNSAEKEAKELLNLLLLLRDAHITFRAHAKKEV